MMQTVLRNPRRKKRCRAVLYQCLPIPFDGCGPDDWPNYQAYLQDGLVSVENPDSMFQLYNMGYFGKGILSRSGPTYNKRHFTDQGERILSKRKYERHLDWENRAKRFKEEESYEFEEDDPAYDEDVYQEYDNKDVPPEYEDEDVDKLIGSRESPNQDYLSVTSNVDNKCHEFGNDLPENVVNGTNKLIGSSELQNQVCISDALAMDNKDAESELENPKITCQNQPKVDSSTCETDPPILMLGSSDTGHLIGEKQSSNYDDLPHSSDDNKHTESVRENPNISSQDQPPVDSSTCETYPIKLVLGSGINEQLIGEKQSSIYDDLPHSSDDNKHTESVREKPNTSSQDPPTVDSSTCETDPLKLVLGSSINDQLIGEKQSSNQDDLPLSLYDNKHAETEHEMEIPKMSNKAHPSVSGFSAVVDTSTYDNDPLLLVVEDSDSDKEEVEGEDQSWVMKTKDPYPLWESLQLGYEETFFLAFGLGCLTVIDDNNNKKLTLTKLWRRFLHSNYNFIKNYIAYHHFRSKGWVVKDGLKYGTDFLLYKDGPPFYHGTYSVIVTMIDEDTLMPLEHFGNRTFTLPSLAGLNRVNERVAKDLLFCDVVKPSYLSDRDMKDPNCISSFQVQEILMRRWVSNQEREKKTESDG